MLGGNISDAVAGSDENQPLDRAIGGERRCDAASEAPPNNGDGVVVRCHPVKEGMGVRDECRFRRSPSAATVASVVHDIDRAIGKLGVEI